MLRMRNRQHGGVGGGSRVSAVLLQIYQSNGLCPNPDSLASKPCVTKFS